ncbi:MAG TPA: hypothetical protein VD833_03675 [Vicinamibacterales bacterium]|nr:hypothetical protein [Vicinamibacterales bacterium]
MTYIDSVVLNLTERACHRFQRLTGATNVWLAVQLTNLSIIAYFVWVGGYPWSSRLAPRIFVGLFCCVLLYALSQTVFKVPVEAYERSVYQRVSRGLMNPRRLRDAPLRIAFLTLSCFLWYPLFFVYLNPVDIDLRVSLVLLGYALVVLTTAVLYLLACDPLPPCPGRIRDWLRAAGRSRLTRPELPTQR